MSSFKVKLKEFYESNDLNRLGILGTDIFSEIQTVPFQDLLDVRLIIQNSLEQLSDHKTFDNNLGITVGANKIDMALLFFQNWCQKEEFFTWIYEKSAQCQYLADILKNVCSQILLFHEFVVFFSILANPIDV